MAQSKFELLDNSMKKYIHESEQQFLTEILPTIQSTRTLDPEIDTLGINIDGSGSIPDRLHSSHTVLDQQVQSHRTDPRYFTVNPVNSDKKKGKDMGNIDHTHLSYNEITNTEIHGKGRNSNENYPVPNSAIQVENAIVSYSQTDDFNDPNILCKSSGKSRNRISKVSARTFHDLPGDDSSTISEGSKRRLMKSLEKEGQLIMGRCSFLASLIKTVVFYTIEKVSARSKGTMTKFDHICLQEGLEAVKSYFIKAFFGGVCSLCQDNNISDVTKAINAAWYFMSSEYFGRWALMSFENIIFKFRTFNPTDHQEFRSIVTMGDPEDLLGYLIYRKRGDRYSKRSLVEVLKRFCLWTKSQTIVEHIEFQEESFWRTCRNMKKKRKRYDALFKPSLNSMKSTSLKSKKRSRASRMHSNSNNTPSMMYEGTEYRLKSGFDRNIWTKGVSLIQHDSVLRKVLANYFKNLATRLDTGEPSTSLEPNPFKKVAKAAQFFIKPAFLGMIKVFHENNSVNASLDLLIRHATEFLVSTFSHWEKKKITNLRETLNPELTRRKKDHQVDWSNAQETLHFFSQDETRKARSKHFIWYLARQWQENLVQSGIQILEKGILPDSKS